jgi:hypothetical protein
MVGVNKSILETYVDWCIQEGYVSTRINYFQGLSKQDLKNFVDYEAQQNKYITYEELLDMEQQCINAQDAVLPRLVFIGIRGDECSELINLKVSDVHSNKIVLPDREIKIDDSTYMLILDAINQTEYMRGNGAVSESAKTDKMAINSSDYVLRAAGSTKMGKIEYQALRMRLTRIKDYFGNDYLNFRNIWFSGMLHKARMIEKTKGEVTIEDFKQIHKEFGYNPIYAFKTQIEYRELVKKS